MQDIIIRMAQKKDIPLMMSLLRQVCAVHADTRPDLFVHGGTKYNEDQLQELLQDSGAVVFACCDESDVMQGYAISFVREPTDDTATTNIRSLYVDDICVDEGSRRNHIGTRLYEAVRSYARENGFYNITLNVWENNPTARAFYEAMGMSVQKTCMEFIL